MARPSAISVRTLVMVAVVVALLLLLILKPGPDDEVAPPALAQSPGSAIKQLDDMVKRLEGKMDARDRRMKSLIQNLANPQKSAPPAEESEDEPTEMAPIKRSGVRADGRTEFEPIDSGCYKAKSREECCKKIDSRYTIHGPPFYGGSPCFPPANGKFLSGGTCEPEAWIMRSEAANMGDCGPPNGKKAETLEEVIHAQKSRPRKAPEDAHDLNLMWVTDCQMQLEWSSVLLLWSAFKAGQPGDFTRIATGCETERMRGFVLENMKLVAKIFNAEDRLTVHFAPKHITDARDGTNGEVYTPYSKAFGVKHFLDSGPTHNRVGVILDPDFLFNRPLEYRMDRVAEHAVIPAEHTKDWKYDVEPGRPVGQKYGLGAGWKHAPYDLKEICGENSPCTRVSEADAWRYFTMGPPIFMTIGDWRKVAQGWYDYLPVIRAKHKDWMEEMRSYTMSAAHNEQKTSIFTHYQISDKGYGANEEGWPWIDGPKSRLPDICRAGKALNPANFPEINHDIDPWPPILHYCQAYEPEYYDSHWVWSKYQINFGAAQEHGGNLLDCDQPFYQDPPKDLLEAQVHTNPRCLGERRQAWMLCQITFSINEMLADFKKQKCGDNFNKKRTAKHRFAPRKSKVDHPDECRKPRP